MIYAFSQRDVARIERTIRKIERLIQIHAERKRPVFMGLVAGGSAFPVPTGKKYIEPIVGNSDPVDVYLTRDDRSKLIHWDQMVAIAAPYNDDGERRFYLPDNPEVGDTFWFCLRLNPYINNAIRFASLDHSIACPQFEYSGTLWEDFPFSQYIHSYSFDPDDERFERGSLTLTGCQGAPLQPITTCVIMYTGATIQKVASYVDLDDDGYFNNNPGDDEPLVYGESRLWTLLHDQNAMRNTGFIDPYWWSFDPWPDERHY